MNQHRVVNHRAEDAQRAALRDRVLAHARRLGWPARTAIAFTEQVTRHPWKRCSGTELAAVLDELHAVLGASGIDRDPWPTSRCSASHQPSDRRDTDVAHD